MRSMDAIGYLDFYEPSILPDGSRDASLPAISEVFMIAKRSVT